MDDEFKKDEPLMGSSSKLDAEVADFGKDASDSFDEKKPEAESAVDEEPVSEIGAAMDAMLNNEENAESDNKTEDETKGEEKTDKDTAVEGAATEVVAAEVSAENAKPEKKKSKAGLLIALIVLILIVAGVVCAIMLMPKDSKQANKGVPSGPDEEVSTLKLKDNSLSNFDLKFLQLENNDKNMIYSPLSIKYALAMLQDGAAGDSKTQIDEILGEYTPKKYINSKNMSLANAFFVRDTFKDSVKSEYVEDINKKYAAELVYDSFSSANNINKWIGTKTLGQISNLLTDDSIEDKSFMLVNALALDMEWNYTIQAAEGSKVKALYDWVDHYSHENITDEKPKLIYLGNGYESMTFNENDNSMALKFAANANRYNIIEEKGEDTIRATVKDGLEKWLKEEADEDGSKNEDDFYRSYDSEDEFLDEYMEKLKKNYGRKSSSTDFMFYVNDSVKVFAKNLKEYDGTTLQYVAIMPTDKGLNDYINGISAEGINDLINNLKDARDINSYKDGVFTDLDGVVPVFKFEYDLGVQDDLKEMGIKDVFDSAKADLSTMTTDNIYVEMMHKAKIEFSNEGIKAAAVTTIDGIGEATHSMYDYLWDVPIEKIDLTFDKPFLFLIRDKATGEVWFTGTVYEGVENK